MRRAVLICFIIFASSRTSLAQQQPPADIVIRFLGLSPAQVTQFRTSLGDLQSAVSEIQPRLEAKQRELNTLLSAEIPNEADAGRVLVELNALQREQQRAIQLYQERFRSLLVPEQMERVMLVIQARQLLPAVMAFAAVQLVPPPLQN